MQNKTLTLLGILFISLVTITGMASGAARASGELPPRPPTATPVAQIILEGKPATQVSGEQWAVVQWLDGLGNWQLVDGWQGQFEKRGQNMEVIWWVAPGDYGKGPFRWVVYERKGSERIVAISQPFYLPNRNKSYLRLEVVLSTPVTVTPTPIVRVTQTPSLIVTRAQRTNMPTITPTSKP